MKSTASGGDAELSARDSDEVDCSGRVHVPPPDRDVVFALDRESVAVRTSYSGWFESSAIGTLGANHGRSARLNLRESARLTGMSVRRLLELVDAEVLDARFDGREILIGLPLPSCLAGS